MKACVIGMGPIGNKHARAYKMLDFCELTAVCDIREDRAIKASKEYGVPYYTNASEMIMKHSPDICSVATGGFEYSSDHFAAVMDALNGGCDVLCEKPLSNDLHNAVTMVETAKKYGRRLAVDFNHRFTPCAYQVKKWIDDGRIGTKLFCNMALWIGKADFDTEYYHIKALNPHSVNMMEYFCGEIERVSCFATKAPGRHMYSTASFNMMFKNGAVGHLTSSYDISRAHPMERFELGGTNGRAVFENMWRDATLYPAETMLKEVYTNPVFGGYRDFDDTFNERIRCFAKAVYDKVPPKDIDGSGEEGLRAVKVIHSAIKSLKNGNIPIKVDETDE